MLVRSKWSSAALQAKQKDIPKIPGLDNPPRATTPKPKHIPKPMRNRENPDGSVTLLSPFDRASSCRNAYVHLTTGDPEYLYGILAYHGALRRAQSPYEHVVMVTYNVSQDQISLFNAVGIRTVLIDPDGILHPLLANCTQKCVIRSFYKLFIFNMTEYDKVCDVS